jgi:hypothetical protein
MIPERVQNVKRTADMAPIERQLIIRLYNFLKDKRESDSWWKHSGTFVYDSREYEFSCEVRLDQMMLTYRKLHISYKTIEVDIAELERQGLLN